MRYVLAHAMSRAEVQKCQFHFQNVQKIIMCKPQIIQSVCVCLNWAGRRGTVGKKRANDSRRIGKL